MNNNTSFKVVETKATNKDFYNLFRPIVPGLDIMGKVAQIISALTEGITIWKITQSELSGFGKTFSISVSIFAMILVILLLEFGGRKFLQVLTRTLVWKRFQNIWYISTFVIVLAITISLGILSFKLSTNGIRYSFVSKVEKSASFNAAPFQQSLDKDINQVTKQFKDELSVLENNQQTKLASAENKYAAQINAQQVKVNHYHKLDKQGKDWAASQARKYQNKMADLGTTKANAVVVLNQKHAEKVADWQHRKNQAIVATRKANDQKLRAAQTSFDKSMQGKVATASFWGNLFSYLIGFSVILAFVCIITVEVFRRGSGIQVEYQELEKQPSLLAMLFNGLKGRFDRFFRSKAERFVSLVDQNRSSIGFNNGGRTSYSNQADTNYNSQSQNSDF